MKTEVAVKGLKFNFKQDETYQKVEEVALEMAKELYTDEKAFQEEEFEAMLADNEVFDFKEYQEMVLDIQEGDIDYSKPFEESMKHPNIQIQIASLTNKYMCNVNDLPRNAVVMIDDTAIDEKGNPSEIAINSALKEKFGKEISVSSYDFAMKAEKKDVLSQEAYEKVGEMMASKDYQTFLDLRASIGKYSLNNIALIYTQKSDAKAVMGFNAWKKLDRHVDAGQKGISIWQPCKRELKNEKQVDNYIGSRKDYFGNSDSLKAVRKKEELMRGISSNGSVEVDMGFRLGTTFDISQTVPNNPEHDNISEIIALNKPLNQDLENYDLIVKSMKDAATILPLSISQSDSQQDDLYDAIMRYADKAFKEAPEQIKGIKSNIPLIGDMHKIESVMSAHMICQHIGIDSGEKAGLKLAEIFNKDKFTKETVIIGKREMFTQAFDRACKLYDQFTKDFDKSFGIDIEAQRNAIKEAKEAEWATKRAAKGNSKKSTSSKSKKTKAKTSKTKEKDEVDR